MKITNNEQFQKLVAELKKKPSLAKGFKKGTVPTNFNQQWENIASILNASGPPSRDGDGWQKVWRDFKFKVKKKVAKKSGGINKYIILSPLEEAVANLMEFEKQINPEGSAHGVTESYEEFVTEVFAVDPDIEMQTTVYCDEILMNREEPSTSRNGSSSRATTPGSRSTNIVPLRAVTPVNPKKPSDRQHLLEKHSTMQEKILTEISNTLLSVKRSIKDTCCYHKRLLEVEQKKIKLMEKQEQRKNEEHEEEMKNKSLKKEEHEAEMKIKSLKIRILESLSSSLESETKNIFQQLDE